jgi:eukaryotic-like serine/threonine-protein kinase
MRRDVVLVYYIMSRIGFNGQEEWIIREAQQRPPAERDAFLDGACAGDPGLRQRVEGLLAAQAQSNPLWATRSAAVRAHPKREFADDPPLEAVGQMLGRYKLLEKVGEGGCGVVYVADQTKPVRRRVALKVIKLGMDTKQVVARFEAERQALAMMDHPNIAKVLDAGATETGRPYFVMELVRGIKITDYCDQASLSTRDRLELFIKVCQAIQHAHQKGIIHRDIKPSNILITLHDGVPVPKVIDFGIAKATEGRLTDATVYTQLHQFMGTPAYMSPEQAEMSGLDIDTRSDIYSLGVLLYELLTGSTPFDGVELMASGIDQMCKTIREKDPARPSAKLAMLRGEERTTTAKRRSVEPSRLASLLRGDLDWIVMKCLEKDRSRRYDTANGLANDIKRYLNIEPIVARPPSKLYEFQKSIRRHKVGFAATAAIIFLLAAGIAVTTWQFVEKNRAYNLAVVAEKQQALERRRAEQLSEQSRARAVRLNVAYGVRWMEAGDLLSSLQWFIEALRLDEGDSGRAGIHRVRIGAVLRNCPKPTQLWWLTSTVLHVEFSPDGQRILSAHEDGTAQLWDTRTGQRVGPPLLHAQPVNWAAFSPESRRVVTASDDSTVRVWDAASGQSVAPPIRHPDKVSKAVFSPDGQRLLVGGHDGTARIWDPVSEQPLTPPMRHAASIEDVGFSPDGRRVITASTDGTAQIWDAATGAAAGSPLRHQAGVVRASFSPEGRRVVTASRDNTARIWDAVTGEPLTPPLRHTTWLTDARFNPDNSTVATASFDNTARIWDAETGRPVCSPLRHGHSVMTCAFSPDGQRLITSCFNQTAQVWDAATGERLLSPLKHSGYVSDALFSPDGRKVLTCGFDRAMRLWEVATRGSFVARLDVGGAVDQLAFSGDGRRIATADTNGVVRFWDSDTGQLLPVLVRHTASVRQLAFSPNERQILLADGNGAAQLFDAASGQSSGSPMELGQPIDVAGFSPDGRRVFVGTHQGLIRVWDAVSGEPITPLLQITNSTRLVAFNRDGSRVIAVGTNQFAQVWDTLSGRPLSPPIGHPSDVVSAAFSPDDRKVVTSCSDDSLAKLAAQVWDAATGVALVPALQHQDGVLHAAFSPDGRSIVTASEDGTAGIWDAETGRLRAPFLRHDYQVFYAAFSPDGRFIATASRDMTARVWDAGTGEPVTPPLHHAAPVEFAAFNASGDRLATRSRDGRSFLWNLTPENRGVAELVRLGQLMNSRQIDSSGGALPVDTATLEDLWRQVRAAQAGAVDTPVETIAAWHEQEAGQCEASQRWFGAVFHLRHLLELNQRNPELSARLAVARGALEQEELGRAYGHASAKRLQAPKSGG